MASYVALRVDLLGVTPPIWRSFLLGATTTFDALHAAILDSCGWKREHSASFHDAQSAPAMVRFLTEDQKDEVARGQWGPAAISESKILSPYLCDPGHVGFYRLDVGNDHEESWWHSVTVEAVLNLDEVFGRRLTGGQRACPLERHGDMLSYYDYVAVLSDEVGVAPAFLAEIKAEFGNWHPETFDLESARGAFDR